MSEPIYKLSQLTKSISETDMSDIMSLQHEDDEGEFVEHPIINLLKEKVVKSVDIPREWTDDHLFCCLLTFQFEGDDETYLLSAWWFDPTNLLLVGKSVNNIEEGKRLGELFDVIGGI